MEWTTSHLRPVRGPAAYDFLHRLEEAEYRDTQRQRASPNRFEQNILPMPNAPQRKMLLDSAGRDQPPMQGVLRDKWGNPLGRVRSPTKVRGAPACNDWWTDRRLQPSDLTGDSYLDGRRRADIAYNEAYRCRGSTAKAFARR